MNLLGKSKLNNNQELIKVLKSGGVAIMSTDTIYGIVGRAEDKEAVEKVYKIRGRSPLKPCIVLIGDIKELEKFNITLTEEQKNKIGEYFGKELPVSLVFDCQSEEFSYLHRGTETLAFRLPHQKSLQDLLL